MKTFLYIIFLVCSLPNLLAGFALLVLQHSFVSHNPLKIAFEFLFAVVWGVPAALVIFIALLVTGCFSIARPYAALLLFLLNIAALGLVLFRLGSPHDFDEAMIFLPVGAALIGSPWIAYRGLVRSEPLGSA